MNKAILMGRLTKDPELRYTSTNNTPVCSFTLAVDRRFSRQGEERQADFIPVVAWDKLAEFCSKYFQKGKQVAVVGRIQTRTWDDNEGKRHYITEVIAEEAHFAESKRSDERSDDAYREGNAAPGGSENRPQGNNRQAGGREGGAPASAPESSGAGQAEGFYTVEDDEDKLPF
ncbi:MAG: single-stranded DNA-binding protein [Eubacteriales bacterium]|nr:single-stranded DNA-binding protein [Eubacteriales bacterium]